MLTTLLASMAAGLCGIAFAAPVQTLAHKETTPTALAVPLSGSFSDGYRAGYKKANPYGLCPLPPLPPIGADSYGDGFGIGYAQGMADKN